MLLPSPCIPCHVLPPILHKSSLCSCRPRLVPPRLHQRIVLLRVPPILTSSVYCWPLIVGVSADTEDHPRIYISHHRHLGLHSSRYASQNAPLPLPSVTYRSSGFPLPMSLPTWLALTSNFTQVFAVDIDYSLLPESRTAPPPYFPSLYTYCARARLQNTFSRPPHPP